MSCELVETDKFGDRVELDHSNWQEHLPRRPEIVHIHPHLPIVLRDPDAVVEYPDGQRHFYRGGLVAGKYRSLYIRVIVGYFGGVGKIKTCWFDSTVDTDRGTILWLRQMSRS